MNGDLVSAQAVAGRQDYGRLIADLDASGAHARSAIGVAALPLGTPVEVEAIAQVSTGAAHQEAQPQ